jgi:hypothetical protein
MLFAADTMEVLHAKFQAAFATTAQQASNYFRLRTTDCARNGSGPMESTCAQRQGRLRRGGDWDALWRLSPAQAQAALRRDVPHRPGRGIAARWAKVVANGDHAGEALEALRTLRKG